MKETRIPYSLPMARARRAGLKTQTRRAVKPQPPGWVKVWNGSNGDQHFFFDREEDDESGRHWPSYEEGLRCPYGQPGDILLPVEPWRAPVEFDKLPPRDIPAGVPIWLDANGPAPEGFGRYRHGKFMPKHLIVARDELVEVRVERLQDISPTDAMAEGVTHNTMNDPRVEYRWLWESINGPGSWEANPFVWVVTFRKISNASQP